MSPKLIAGLIITALVAIFIIQNTHVIEVTFYLWQIKMSKSLLLLGALIIGFILGWINCKLMRKSRK